MKLETAYKSNNYPIIIEHHALDQLHDYIKNYQDIVLVIDQKVENEWSHITDFIASEYEAHKLIVPSGETTKTLSFYEETIESLLSKQLTRNTCLIAIGGGATGDFTGFLASTLLRGVDFIQIPTTILAHDSSVGGKVGINSKHGKNLIGAFYRPKAVIYDLNFLSTLPYSEILSGYAEVYKHALLNDIESVNHIEAQYSDEQALKSLDEIEYYLYKGVQTKLNIIVADEKESNVRKFLNLGHTFGHAVEYKFKIPHGHAVMIGIVFQFIVTNIMLNKSFNIAHYVNYLRGLNYPLDIVNDLEFESLYKLMLNDKKNDEQGVQMVLLKDIGDPIVRHVDYKTLSKAFAEFKSYFNK
ncbi:3-dehydroquinate synthase [Staphylococcus sp. KG4-3]|uniref:3-dehydroquinate synthase n=1 Tax=Staphylococcus xylosus TaxID=1288 RepID=A0A418ILA1_STAXY|nr:MULTISPECIES: 3-dehydroquinate synthase [Staphylococcus]MDW8542207.1 3-dehydroquinate synthase [Staphylococcus sp. KG4-1]MDW8561563.1 3-dehydroquinate synthase [Staphylococcus sp. KG4-3]RIN08657.1 3-dehydroquinate synthase [Staphylococcus xylosus]